MRKVQTFPGVSSGSRFFLRRRAGVQGSAQSNGDQSRGVMDCWGRIALALLLASSGGDALLQGEGLQRGAQARSSACAWLAPGRALHGQGTKILSGSDVARVGLRGWRRSGAGEGMVDCMVEEREEEEEEEEEEEGGGLGIRHGYEEGWQNRMERRKLVPLSQDAARLNLLRADSCERMVLQGLAEEGEVANEEEEEGRGGGVVERATIAAAAASTRARDRREWVCWRKVVLDHHLSRLRGGGSSVEEIVDDQEIEGDVDAGGKTETVAGIGVSAEKETEGGADGGGAAAPGAVPMDMTDSVTHVSTTEDTGGSVTMVETRPGCRVIKYRHPTKNSKRDGIRSKIAECLAKYEQPNDVYTGITAGIAIEHSMYRFFGKDEHNERYNAKARSILFNLRDANNPDLRRRVLDGTVQPERLTLMDEVEMASDQLKKEREIYSMIALQASTLGEADEQYASTDMFYCRKCQKRKCTYYQMQTRSADEPMTTFVTCLVCGNRWKA